ncbi:hypothetical protein M407DRAFT_33403 [Tulasnella calospora MUT 4182]|uniref:Uncharacterized protein n=1 Tax=Tulasnella calospora MUT 4182 TaxID=1051891 RepID=A0A0C3Q2D9_9AGAM|nr:hypothetical protein M407DRAFT_33403 [Tulasnella calospora MUT 4182]
MRIDGTTRPFTTLDEETGSILLRRLHPRINNFNEVIIFLLQCNMDIKYIGSGEAAKALTFYVTDYITKPCLPVHVGFAAITYALEQNELKFGAMEGSSDNTAIRERSLLTKSVNAMMSKTELSHQQVMSYLIGGGDHYTSHAFRTLYWGSFDRWIRQKVPDTITKFDSIDPVISPNHLSEVDVSSRTESELIASANLMSAAGTVVEASPSELLLTPALIDTSGPHESCFLESERQGLSQNDFTAVEYEVNASEGNETEVILHLDRESITASNQLYDYRFRPQDRPFDNMSLWEMVSSTEKISTELDDTRASKRAAGENSSGRKPLPRGSFLSLDDESHPQADTHRLRTRSDVVPVVLGPTIPRPDNRDEWCRSMLILFKPWRRPKDLKDEEQSWSDAFERYVFPECLQRVMHNLNIQNECKDARDTYNALRRAGKVQASLLPGVLPEEEAGDMEFCSAYDDLELALLEDDTLDAYSEAGSERDIDSDEETLLS